MAVALTVYLVTCISEIIWEWVGVRNSNDTHLPPLGNGRPSLAIQSLRNFLHSSMTDNSS